MLRYFRIFPDLILISFNFVFIGFNSLYFAVSLVFISSITVPQSKGFCLLGYALFVSENTQLIYVYISNVCNEKYKKEFILFQT